MKKPVLYLLLACALCAALAMNIHAEGMREELSSVMPGSVGDLTEISELKTFFNESSKFYSCSKAFVRPGSKLLGTTFVSENGYTVQALVWYYYDRTPYTASQARERVDEITRIRWKGAPIIDIAGSPACYVVSKGTTVHRFTYFSCKGKYEMEVWSHSRDADISRAQELAKMALSYILSRIPDSASSDEKPPTAPAPVTGKDEKGKTISKSPYAAAAAALEEERAKRKAEEERKRKEEYESRMKSVRSSAKELEYKMSEEYKAKKAEEARKEVAKEEAEREKASSRAETSDALLAAMGEESTKTETAAAIEEETAEKIICGGLSFSYYPKKLQKHAKNTEKIKVAGWENNSFEGADPKKRPVSYKGKYYIPVAYVSGPEVSGYLWIDRDGLIVTSDEINRALFSYMYVFGFMQQAKMAKEAEEYRFDADKADKEMQDYDDYKGYAKTLKMASSAMSVYLTSLTGGAIGQAFSASVTGLDAGIFLAKMDKLESAGKAPSDFAEYEKWSGRASSLDTLMNISGAVLDIRNASKMQAELTALKDLNKINTTKAQIEATKAGLMNTALSLGWTLFDAKEGTGQIAEQSAVLAMKYSELKCVDVFISGIISSAMNGIKDETEAKNILLLDTLKARRNKIKGDILSTLIQFYNERKTSISGYIGRLSLYVKGKSVDEDKAKQAVYDLEKLIEMDSESFIDKKAKVDAATFLAGERATL